ncbi:MAG TPA: DUF1080 domain-containing protein, partial [Candidatus Solibacter sp.]|nr:DUF1080 domain-containing protein [Candidatus Solibacter sp.]
MQTRIAISVSAVVGLLAFACYALEGQMKQQGSASVWQWEQHDRNRPLPQVIDPGTASTQDQAGRAPSDAVVLFDGKDLSKWQSGRGGAAQWKIADGYMEVNKTGNIRTRDKFGDFQLHLEFATPSQVSGNSQERGNSGLLINGIYEVQLL